jgi:outer membrane protein OmpA-like peptidoglycan-associated protein
VLGVSAPVVLAGHGTVEDIGPTGALYTSQGNFAQGLGNLALHAKVRIIRPLDKPSIGLAGIIQGGAGVAGSDNLIAENGGFIWPQLAFEGRAAPAGMFRIGLNAGFRANFGGTPASYGRDRDGDPVLEHGVFEYGQLVTAGLGLSARVAPPLDVVAETYSSVLVTGDNALAQRVSAEALGGLKVFIDGKSFLFIGSGGGYAPGFETATARGTLGFVFEPSIGDRDHDGIKDDVDDCPERPEDIDGFEDDDGCPDPDNDKDGIFDVDDACPDQPGQASSDPDRHGCPAIADADEDGVPDSIDACPKVHGVKTRIPRTNGCPADQDVDDIPDAQDACPAVAGVKNPEPNKHGCPVEGSIIVGTDEIFLNEKVQFETASATILPVSNEILDGVARTLKAHPEFVLMEIQGHADERGDELYNLELTRSRARSVMAALIRRQIEPARLRSMGFGPYCPNDEGHDEAAWDKNRRVEFKIVRKEDGPTGAVLGCQRATEKGVQSPPP